MLEMGLLINLYPVASHGTLSNGGLNINLKQKTAMILVSMSRFSKANPSFPAILAEKPYTLVFY